MKKFLRKVVQKTFNVCGLEIYRVGTARTIASTRGSILFLGSQQYWEQRYRRGGTSGSGSYGRLAEFKADIVNSFVKEKGIESIIEFGCGDGNQLSLAAYPRYIGFDVSPTAIKMCTRKFANDKSKSFFLYDPLCFIDNHNTFVADLTLSLDIIFHLVEDHVFSKYMEALFDSSTKYVIIYSSNYDSRQSYHMKHREFTRWVESNAVGWKLLKKIDNVYPFDPSDPDHTSQSDFYIFEKVCSSPA